MRGIVQTIRTRAGSPVLIDTSPQAAPSRSSQGFEEAGRELHGLRPPVFPMRVVIDPYCEVVTQAVL